MALCSGQYSGHVISMGIEERRKCWEAWLLVAVAWPGPHASVDGWTLGCHCLPMWNDRWSLLSPVCPRSEILWPCGCLIIPDYRFSVSAASHSTSQLSQKLKTTYKASTSKVCRGLALGPLLWYLRCADVYLKLHIFQLEMCSRQRGTSAV